MSVTDLPVRSTATSAEHDSPAPRRRWQPYRAGILNVWRYYDETFAFHQGRLLRSKGSDRGRVRVRYRARVLGLWRGGRGHAGLQAWRWATRGACQRGQAASPGGLGEVRASGQGRARGGVRPREARSGSCGGQRARVVAVECGADQGAASGGGTGALVDGIGR